MTDLLTLFGTSVFVLGLALELAAISAAFHVVWLTDKSAHARTLPVPAQVPGSPVPQARAHLLRRMRLLVLLIADGLTLLLAAPFLWFPTVGPQGAALALVLLLSFWFFATIIGGVLWPRSRYDLALILLLLMALLGSLRSEVPTLTLPKVTGLILGVACYRALVVHCRTPRSALNALYIMAGMALLFSLVGLAAGELRATKIPAVARYRTLLPRYLGRIPETQGGVVSTNQLGGSLLYVMPILFALVSAPRRYPRDPGLGSIERIFVLVMTFVLLAALVATQSRGAWLGMAAGSLTILSLRWRWGRWIAVICLAVPMTAWLTRAKVGVKGIFIDVFVVLNGVTALSSLIGRLGLWQTTIRHIRASPWVGSGLGTFRMLDANTTSASSVFDVGVPHAHNFVLQMAFDTGLPGLVGYLAVIFLAFYMSWRAYRVNEGLIRFLAIGCLASLVATTVFGMADVIALGSKPAVLWWGLMALIVALDGVTTQCVLIPCANESVFPDPKPAHDRITTKQADEEARA